jgi:hypothetical protein
LGETTFSDSTGDPGSGMSLSYLLDMMELIISGVVAAIGKPLYLLYLER